MAVTKSDEFSEKFQREGRSFSIQKFMLQGFLSIKWTQKSNLRVQGMFSTIALRKIKNFEKALVFIPV